MADELVPIDQPAASSDAQLQPWQEPQPGPMAPQKSPIERPIAAMRRYKWLMLAIVVVATGGGLAATQFVKPMYEVHADLMVEQQSSQGATGPIRQSTLLEGNNWVQLFKNPSIVDSVVTKLALYVQPDNVADSALFKGFSIRAKFVKGKYELDLDKTQNRWHLASLTSGAQADGAEDDSVGKDLGFVWKLPKSAFAGTGSAKVRFTVVTPQEAAVALIGRVNATLPLESDFLSVTLDDHNPELAEQIVNTWINDYVDAEANLKKRTLVLSANTLKNQLAYSDSQLAAAEAALYHFKVNTITLPTEGGPVAAGVQETRDPVMKDYFDRSLEYQDLKEGRAELLATVTASLAKDSLPYAVLLNPLVAQGGAAAGAIRNGFAELDSLQARRTGLAAYFTPQWPAVAQLDSAIATLRSKTIPQALIQYMGELRDREVDDSTRLAGASDELLKIPSRTIDEMRFTRAVTVAETFNTNLKTRFAEAELAEESATPDVTILQPAVAPLDPSKNTASRLLALAVLGGLGAAIGLAILLDKIDPRFRYPDQATDELGLPIAGTVPRFPKGGVDRNSPEQMFQLVESFRSLRMTVTSATGSPISLAVSSPSPAEGKSFISANLAMSFAEAGLKTVLVDGDTRRGTLHDAFGFSPKPGLTDYLGERASIEEVVKITSYDRLSFIPAGVRQRRSPELLASPLLLRLMDELRSTHDVVILDTPPLAAGIDGYAIASAAGRLLVVLRVGETERRMAAAKLRLLDRLPVDVIGAVLNGVSLRGEYEYYGYVGGYAPEDETPGTDLTRVP